MSTRPVWRERGSESALISLNYAASTEERVSGLRAALEKEHTIAKDILMQRCKNLTHDMDAAFKREWFQANPNPSTPNPNPQSPNPKPRTLNPKT